MKTKIRVIKRVEASDPEVTSSNTEKTEREREREMAITVKSWIGEWRARNLTLKAAAVSLVRSLEHSNENSFGMVFHG
jgi:hypothetical protein